MDIDMNICNNVENSLLLENTQKSFLNTLLGKSINTGIDIGIRYLLPDLIENEVIEIKNALLENGLKEGINAAINSLSNMAKSAKGIVTGNFENVSQIKLAVENGGILDTISGILDKSISIANNSRLINNTVASILKKGKNLIVDNISSKIEDRLTNQEEKIEKLGECSNIWRNYFNNKDFNGMEIQYKKIKKIMNELIPFQNIIKEANVIENLHNLIKNNGGNFNLTEDQLELANKL